MLYQIFSLFFPTNSTLWTCTTGLGTESHRISPLIVNFHYPIKMKAKNVSLDANFTNFANELFSLQSGNVEWGDLKGAAALTHPAGVLQHSGFEQHASPPSEADGPLGRRESMGGTPHTDVEAVDCHTLLRPHTQQLEEVQLDTPHIYLQLPIRWHSYHYGN